MKILSKNSIGITTTFILALLFVEAEIICEDNGNGWAECTSQRCAKGYDCKFRVSYQAANFKPIPEDAKSVWKFIFLPSSEFVNTQVHPKFEIYTNPNTNSKWVYSCTVQYTQKRPVAKLDWYSEMDEMHKMMNKYKAYQAILTNEAGSMVLEAIPIKA
ncbi:hypothetical protein AX774_g4802 [Zancudomyces culisetae]|uniref:Uncharacterized protein n=1 Tax=Zancudomyces culisetae TaxID=1213189 RepID=A0A1R1PL95_ZANCU|nr:hypothetical protein AX774_g4802 [Zancudomyces culisetae]|eukprot:OMH81748.1 hypothetical protein AX774_g4802 [Zancudomyces culisetae]